MRKHAEVWGMAQRNTRVTRMSNCHPEHVGENRSVLTTIEKSHRHAWNPDRPAVEGWSKGGAISRAVRRAAGRGIMVGKTGLRLATRRWRRQRRGGAGAGAGGADVNETVPE
eukprot:gene12266-biopygen15